MRTFATGERNVICSKKSGRCSFGCTFGGQRALAQCFRFEAVLFLGRVRGAVEGGCNSLFVALHRELGVRWGDEHCLLAEGSLVFP